jgi:hypothetical protein
MKQIITFELDDETNILTTNDTIPTNLQIWAQLYTNIHHFLSIKLTNTPINTKIEILEQQLNDKDNQMKTKVNQMKQQLNDRDDIMNTKVKQLKQQMDDIVKQTQDKADIEIVSLKKQISTIAKQTQDKANIEIVSLKQQLADTINQMNIKIEQTKDKANIEIVSLKQQLVDTVKQIEFKSAVLKDKYETIVSCKDNHIKDLINQYDALKTTVSGNANKAMVGEMFAFNHLTTVYNSPDYTITHCASKKASGDICFQHRSTKICIESKNYSKIVPQSEIDKFIRDVNSPEYNAGIMFSYKTCIAKKQMFHIHYTDKLNKPIIFINKLQDNPVCLDIAINLLLNVLSSTDKQENVFDIERLTNFLNKQLSMIHATKKIVIEMENNLNEYQKYLV